MRLHESLDLHHPARRALSGTRQAEFDKVQDRPDDHPCFKQIENLIYGQTGLFSLGDHLLEDFN